MARKDLTTKKLESHTDVFATIFNSLLFESKLIKPQNLSHIPTEEIVEDVDGSFRSLSRDMAMKYSEENDDNYFGLAIFGTENQSALDEFAPVRIMGYDYGSYREQVDRYRNRKRELRSLLKIAKTDDVKLFLQTEIDKRKEFSLTPVITVVLNFSKKSWTTNKSLVDMVKGTNNKFSKWMKNYSIYVYDMCDLSKSQIDRLEGDFKEIAKIFTYGDKADNLRVNGLKYPLDTLDFLIAYRNEESYISTRNRIADMEKKGDVITMGTLVDELERNKIIEAAKSNITLGATDEFVIKFLMINLELSEEEAEEIFIEEVK